MAAGLGSEVTILDRSIPRLRELDELFEGRVRTRVSTIESLEDEVFASDAVIGAVLVPGASAPKLVSRGMLNSMRKGSVIVDVAIDQGGCFETSRATTHADPPYEVDGVVHYCVANMPGAVPLTSSQAAADLSRKHGVSDPSIYKWKARFGGMDVSEAKRLRTLEDENTKLKRLLADAMLDNAALKDLLGKNV